MSPIAVCVPQVSAAVTPPPSLPNRYLGGAPYEYASTAGGTGTSVGTQGFMQCFQATRSATVTHVSVSHESGTPGGTKVIEIVNDDFDTILAQTVTFAGQDNLIGDAPIIHELVAPLNLVVNQFYWVGIRNINAAGGDDLKVHYSKHFDGLCKIAGGTQASIAFPPSDFYEPITVIPNNFFASKAMDATAPGNNTGTYQQAQMRFGLYETASISYTPLTSPPGLTWTRMADSPSALVSDYYGWFVPHNNLLYRFSDYYNAPEQTSYKIYNPSTDTWSESSAYTPATDNQKAVVVGGVPWVLGFTTTGTGRVQIGPFDLDTATFTALYDAPLERSPAAFGTHGLDVTAATCPCAIGSIIYMLLNQYDGDNSTHHWQMWSFDTITHVWTQLAALPTAIEYAWLVTDGIDVYLCQGFQPHPVDQDDVNRDSGLIRRYVVAADKWEFLSNVGPTRTLNDGEAFFHRGFILVNGASDDNNGPNGYDTPFVNAYEIATDRWHIEPDLPLSLDEGALTLYQGRLWMSGGESSDPGENGGYVLLRSSLLP